MKVCTNESLCWGTMSCVYIHAYVFEDSFLTLTLALYKQSLTLFELTTVESTTKQSIFPNDESKFYFTPIVKVTKIN